jgi:hypothetical protein
MYVYRNKLVLLYRSLCLLSYWLPWSGCTLVHCTSVHHHSHVGSYQCWSLSHSFAFISGQFSFFFQCTLHRLQLSKRFLLRLYVEIYKFLFSARSRPRLPQHSNLNTFVYSVALFSCTGFVVFAQFLLLHLFQLWADNRPSAHFVSGS